MSLLQNQIQHKNQFHQNRLKTVTSRPELTSRHTYRHTYIHTYIHPTKEKFPYLVESETSLASLAQSKTSG